MREAELQIMFVGAAGELETDANPISNPPELLILDALQNRRRILPGEIRLALTQKGVEEYLGLPRRSQPRFTDRPVIGLHHVIDAA